jgi:hypothetical protein
VNVVAAASPGTMFGGVMALMAGPALLGFSAVSHVAVRAHVARIATISGPPRNMHTKSIPLNLPSTPL